MGVINNQGKVRPYKTDTDMIKIVKCRASAKCLVCKNKIPSRSFCMGGCWWNRVCLNCSEQFLNNFIESIDDFKQVGIDTLKQIQENKEEYEAVNVMAKI